MTTNPEQASYAFAWHPSQDRFLIASRQTEELIGRETELQKLHDAIYQPVSGREGVEIVFLRGRGGMGKSRLAEEVLWRAGNEGWREKRGKPSAAQDWSQGKNFVLADILDLTQTSFHFAQRFMQEIREALLISYPELEEDFSEFANAARQYQRYVLINAGVEELMAAAKFAEEAFLSCYRKIAKKVDRVVLTLDTCEKLSYSHTNWLIKAKLLKREDFPYISQWLIRQIQNGQLPNTTLLLVGRMKEGEDFYNLLEESIQQEKSSRPAHVEKIDLSGFTKEETRQYFTSLARSWEKYAAKDQRDAAIASDFRALASDDKRLSVLWRYTGGQPVRLALYSDLIVEGQRTRNEQGQSLFDTPETAEKRVPGVAFQGKHPDAEQEELIQKLLEPIQAEIESSFISLLFNRAGLRAEIMKALVRTPRGLDANQLYYILHPDAQINETADPEKFAKIKNEIETLRSLTIVKQRPDDRLGLQDEVYHIYAVVMDGSSSSRKAEIEERAWLYRRLADYAERKKTAYQKERAGFMLEDQQRLDLRNPADAPHLVMPAINERDQEHREQVFQSLDLWRKEELHYHLLMNLSDGMNSVAYQLATRNKNMSGHPDDFSDMEEIYQVLYYEDFLRFVDLPSYPAQIARGEEVIDVLHRFMRQMEVTRWLGRFVMLLDQPRVEKFYQQVEEYIGTLSEYEQHSWNHTLSKADRLAWYEYMRIMISPKDTQTAVDNLGKAADMLEELARTPNEVVSKTGEKGFIGHPGLERVKRTLAFIYNTLGYAYANLGREHLSSSRYSRAVMLLRSTAAEDRFQMALVDNNLSRVLSDMGRGRARRVCLDALDLRREEGFLVPVAYSTNTLALIDNDHNHPELAWIEAAMAGAYFRQAGLRRGVGLAMIQLGEALRRLAGSERTFGRALPAGPGAIYNAAEEALMEALQIFTTGKEAGEVLRRIEAEIELGCLMRDLLIRHPEDRARLYKYANQHLETAIKLAKQYGYARLELDAKVNLAWAHYNAGFMERAEKELAECDQLTPETSRITPKHLPNIDEVDSYLFQQLSKMYGLRGKIAMDSFIDCAREIDAKYEVLPNIVKFEARPSREERNQEIDQDPVAQQFLEKAADHYTLALAYAQLFSPRSGALAAIYDAVYARLKTFNDSKVTAFYRYQGKMRKKYHVAKLRLVDLGDLGDFMSDCIGIPEVA